MAVKTANISIRVEPSIKLQGIPFQATLPAPLTREEMDDATFDAIMQRGLDEAKAKKGCPASEVIANLRKGL